MKTPFENQEFCREAFEEALPEDFREEAIAGMARAAKGARRARRGGGVAVMGLLIATLGLMMAGRKSGSPERRALAAVRPAAWMLRSGELPAGMVVHSTSGRVEMVKTEEGARFDLISDEQLMALARDRHVGLVRSMGRVEVLFLEEGAGSVE